MLENLDLSLILGFAGTALSSGAVTHFLARRKFNAGVKTDEIENLKKSLEFYEKFVQDTNSRLESYIRRNEDDRVELYKLQDTVQYLLKMSCAEKECSNRKYIPLNEIEDQVIRRKPGKLQTPNNVDLKHD